MNEVAAHLPYDALERRNPQQREIELLAMLPRQVAHARTRTTAYAELLAGVDPAQVTSRDALARLPVLRKQDLLERQRQRAGGDVFGGLSAIGWRGLHAGTNAGAKRVFQSPGPIYEPQGHRADYWRLGRALHAAGFRCGDLLHNSFSYHLTPAASMIEAGADAIGCTVFPAGAGNTELQLQAMVDLQPHGYAGTPSFLKILLDKAQQSGMVLQSLRKALVSGEACPPSLRDWLTERGVDAYQAYATADIGLIAYETSAREGLVLDEGVLVEIVRPGTGDPLPDGEVGELVITTFNPDHPLIRFGTGDLSAILPGTCPSGRTNRRIRGWLGRADQTAKVRGMFVHPAQIASVLACHPQAVRGRLVISGEMADDRMRLLVEAATDAPEDLAERIAQSVREITKLRCEVERRAPGTLPNDGKVIEDLRSYD